MRRLTSTLVAGVALVALPHLALAQRRAAANGPKNEIGVDLGAEYNHTGSGCTASCGGLGIGTPIDVRWGFMASGPLSFEPRFSLSYLSGSASPIGGHVLAFNPDLNVLYSIGSSMTSKCQYHTCCHAVGSTNDHTPGGPIHT